MKFEVCKKNCIVFSTEYKECMPTADKLKSMQSAGYTFKLNDKKITLKQLTNVLKN